MEPFPWWTEEHKKFAAEVKEFVDEVMPRSDEARWKREFPRDIFNKIGERGYTGAGIPKEYGGLGLGAVGACIATEEICRMPGAGFAFTQNMLGGLRQIERFGTEELDQVMESLEQKKLVKLYRGRRGIELAKATYEGLGKVNPPEYYRWFPWWVKKENVF